MSHLIACRRKHGEVTAPRTHLIQGDPGLERSCLSLGSLTDVILPSLGKMTVVGGGSVVCCSFDKIRNPLVSRSMAEIVVYQVLACQEPGSVLCASDLVNLHRRSLLMHFTGEETVPPYHSHNLDFLKICQPDRTTALIIQKTLLA